MSGFIPFVFGACCFMVESELWIHEFFKEICSRELWRDREVGDFWNFFAWDSDWAWIGLEDLVLALRRLWC